MNATLIDNIDIDIDQLEVQRLLGSREDSRFRENKRFNDAYEESIARAGDLIEPRGIYTVAAGRDLPGSRMFEALERMAFCICTVGGRLEEEVTALSSGGDILKAVVLDAIGSVAAESTADFMEKRIRDEAMRDGLEVSCRASPGYGDWDIREQACIFRLLPADRIGVRLSESFMMTPRKSVSFAVHIAEHPVRLRSENSCRNCDVENCPYRLLE
jgi:hypothetical protein